MRLLCWNLGAAFGRWRDEPGLHERAWHWVAAIDPDVALLQETVPPDWARQRWSVHAEPFSFWASALVSRRDLAITPLILPPDSILGRFESYLATGELALANGQSLVIASVHTRATAATRRGTNGLDRDAIARRSVGEPWWNDVAFAGYRKLVEGRRFIVGGDWNTSRYVDANGNPTPSGAEFFSRADEAGWRELTLDADGREGKTWYGSTNPRPHQPDHVFADAETAAALRSFAIEPWPVASPGLSDHAPLLLDLDLVPAAAESDAALAVETEHPRIIARGDQLLKIHEPDRGGESIMLDESSELAPFEALLGFFDQELRLPGMLDKRGTNLLTITGYARLESVHSDVVAWLLDPAGSHGFGTAVLEAILRSGWGDDAVEGLETATVHRETGRIATRSDIRVVLGATRLIVENKVDAPERPNQCDDLFDDWGTATRYLLLSPSGAPPSTARRPEARPAWRSLSYGSLARLLSDLLGGSTGPGRAAVEDYVETLAREFPPSDRFEVHQGGRMNEEPKGTYGYAADVDVAQFNSARVAFFLRNRPAITALQYFEDEFALEFKQAVRDQREPIATFLAEGHGPLLNGLTSSGSKHPVFWRQDWVGSAGRPLVTIGLGWDCTDPSRDCLYSGLFVPDSDVSRSLREWFKQGRRTQPADDWVAGLYPVAYRYLPPAADWWKDLATWRQSMAIGVDVAWRRFAPRIEVALADLRAQSPTGASPTTSASPSGAA